MKKYLLLSALFLFIAYSLTGQRLDEQKHSFSFLQLPKTPLQGQFESYSVRIDPGTMSLASMGLVRSQMAKEFFKLEGYELKPAEGDFEILVTFDGDFLVSKEAKTKTKTVGKGDDAKKVITHYYDVFYRIPITYQISDGKRIIMVEEIFSSYDRTFRKEFGRETSASALLKRWDDAGATFLNKWVRADLTTLLNSLGNEFRNQFDTRISTRQVPFYSIKKAEKIGYEDFASRMSEVRPIVESASADKVLSLEDFGTLIDDWKAVLQSADPEDKKESVAFQAAAYNLAMANALSGNYGDGLTFAGKLEESNKRTHLKKNVDGLIEELKDRYSSNQSVEYIYHPTFDSANAALNATPISGGSVPIPVAGHVGYVILHSNGDTIDGFLYYDYARRTTPSTESVSLKGIRVENAAKNPASRYFNISEIASAWDNEQFKVPVEIGVGPISIVTIQRVVHMVDGLWLTQNTFEGDNSYCLLRIVLNKRGVPKRKVYAIDGGLAFTRLNSGLANKFENCPTILQKATAGEYKRTETSYLQILVDYDGCEPDLGAFMDDE